MADNDIIVLPTDFSVASLDAVRWGLRLGGALNAQLHAVYVLEEPQIYGTLEMGPLPLPSSVELADSAETRLKKFVDHNLGSQDPPATGKVLIGRAADEIVQYADDVGASMIVMAVHGNSGVRHLLLGSTTESVLRHANCPVLSIRAD